MRSFSAQQSPHLMTFCTPEQAMTTPIECLPSFLTIDYGNVQQFDSTKTQCAAFAGSGALSDLQVTVDIQTYLHGAQCSCQQAFFWPPQYDNVTGLTCIGCPVSANAKVPWCQCDSGALQSCYAVQNTLSGTWTALECPYVAAPSVTACSFRGTASSSSSNTTCTNTCNVNVRQAT
eukprot:TRINITY_DN7789_c0_g1_i1.p1 TRINITY_DN7789_c0_g1~~TRINITY_DN7789_c0_g1_i1.p1  ORF type:complete len:176 (+),score=27.40 TRINITY_DN7789_c0_g1_i1:426-953(+)